MPDHDPNEAPRARIRRALLAPSRRQVVVAILLALVGFAAITQVRTAGTDEAYAGLRQGELITVLDGLNGARQRTEAEINRLEDVATDLRDDTTKRQTALKQAQDQIDTLNVLAGLVPVTGPGIRITIREETGQIRLGTMLDVIQQLRTVGAEAVAINGAVRVIAQTSFAVTEDGFQVDGVKVQAPYVIDVIGDPSALSGAISFGLGPKKQIGDDGGSVAVREVDTVDIDVIAKRKEPRYSTDSAGQ
ncbi:MAG: DUF881 domain-containing protein [Nocardioidaceae bacterium]|nr:DUF881 domain-containing protein [Nocardioidaceae bacterium]